jgi:hypothetical protein
MFNTVMKLLITSGTHLNGSWCMPINFGYSHRATFSANRFSKLGTTVEVFTSLNVNTIQRALGHMCAEESMILVAQLLFSVV